MRNHELVIQRVKHLYNVTYKENEMVVSNNYPTYSTAVRDVPVYSSTSQMDCTRVLEELITPWCDSPVFNSPDTEMVVSNNYLERLYLQEKNCVKKLHEALEKVSNLRDCLADIHGCIYREKEEEKKNDQGNTHFDLIQKQVLATVDKNKLK